MKSTVGLVVWTAVVISLCGMSQLANVRPGHLFPEWIDAPPANCNASVDCVENAVVDWVHNAVVDCAPNSKRSNPAALLYTAAGHSHAVDSSLDDDRLAPLTRWAQSYIYQNQYVPDCSSGRQIMVTHGYKSGFGAEMHVIGAMLGYALQHNHTLVLSPQTCASFVDQSTCENGCACLFKPISNCVYSDVVNPTTISINKVGTGPPDLAAIIQNTVPAVLKQALLLALPSMSADQMKYWWRAQSVAFIMRFNDATVDAVRRLRVDASKHYSTSGVSPLLPTGAFAIHIRGGDKYQEMTLVPATRYIDAVVRNIQNTPLSFASRTVFVSSDDDNSLTEAREYAERLSLPFVYTLMYRQSGGHSLSTWQRQGSITTNFYNHLLQLLISLEADSWIGTRASNWNRLIDELRCVWVDKCSGIYTEIGDSYAGYNW